jgi:hypothetical protein
MRLMADLDIPFAWTKDYRFLRQSKFDKIDDQTLQKHMINTGLVMEGNLAQHVRYKKGPNEGTVQPMSIIFLNSAVFNKYFLFNCRQSKASGDDVGYVG